MPTLYWTTQPQLPQTKSATRRTDWQQAKTTIVNQKLAGNLQSCCGAQNPAMSSRLQVLVTFEFSFFTSPKICVCVSVIMYVSYSLALTSPIFGYEQ